MFWLEMLSCSSRAFNSGSLKISHHLPRSIASLGCATFQPSASLNWVGDSLYTGAAGGAVGWRYFGPTLHPVRSRHAAAYARRMAFWWLLMLRLFSNARRGGGPGSGA